MATIFYFTEPTFSFCNLATDYHRISLKSLFLCFFCVILWLPFFALQNQKIKRTQITQIINSDYINKSLSDFIGFYLHPILVI
ncbi:MAG: hypothetical protein COS68_04820 [Elusimicrobia bacterium CG06_land_8_20_14_3_00_38_11]|nr:MAG: hypothetical protein COS68_04820 [Elusimicrobia bacterium CG06_land_8_20_14_3_00_38_11]